ncbi:MAG: transposase [Chloroflexota bacterium]
MLYKIPEMGQGIQSFFTDMREALAQQVVRMLEDQLEREVSTWLYREHYQRRQEVNRRSQASCQKCGSQEACQFMRNGYRDRTMVTQFGVLQYRLPRVKCVCGGSVSIPFSVVRPYQQIWQDVVVQIQRSADLGLSLRQMQSEIGEQYEAQVGLRTLNQVVQDVEQPTEIILSSVPPVVMLDAIWLTLLTPTGTIQTDDIKRQREVKTKQKVCVLVALGLYPQSGRWGILGWHIAQQESKEAWQDLLVPLETRGLYRERGLELFIHDGGKGLRAALDYLYPHIPHQRCTFHKLRNLWHSIHVPEGLTKQERLDYKLQLLQPIQAIFYADDETEARQLRDAFVRGFGQQQPHLVATLQRDWHETIAFFKILNHFPDWRRTALRTTSLLERVNRMLRRLFRPKGAFHSLQGLLATVARVLNPKRLI